MNKIVNPGSDSVGMGKVEGALAVFRRLEF